MLTSLLVAHGVDHVVVCPGSRNAPLVHNFSVCPGIQCHPVTDERSAGFIALGLRQRLGRPVAVCVTSGSALLNLAPAVAEATYQHQGIIVISADRPSAWIGQLDGQTMPQPGVFGKFTAYCADISEIHDGTQNWEDNRKINEALLIARSINNPSVHINIRISEPLFNFSAENLPAERKIDFMEPDCDKAWNSLMDKLFAFKKVLLVLGQTSCCCVDARMAELLEKKVALLTEPISADIQCHAEQIVSCIDNFPQELRDALLPDCVIYAGGNTISKKLRCFLREQCSNAYHVSLSPDTEIHDVSCNTRLAVRASSDTFLKFFLARIQDEGTEPFATKWRDMKAKILARHESFVPAYSEMLAIKLFEEGVKPCDCVHYANSMPVRLGSVYSKHHSFCNRGLNGIDGSVSTAAGASLVQSSEGKLYCVCGDLSFFYDENSLWQNELAGNFRILLLNNSQGGIFKSLHGLEKSPVNDSHIAGAHGLDAEGVCRQFNVRYLKAEDEAGLVGALGEFFSLSSDRPVLLEVRTDADTDQKVYDKYTSFMTAYGMDIN